MADSKRTLMILNENEKLLFENIQKSNVGEVMRLLNEKDVRVDCLDDNGMTPLQHAAYRGHEVLCRLLLDRGADVNSNFHEHGYTALMFAGLAGNTDVASMLLAAGASTTAVNSVKRNAAQMAAFVGNHAFVSVVNNFIPKTDVEYYTVARGLEVEPKLQGNLVTPLHRLLVHANVHPVYVALYLQQNGPLYEAAGKVSKVLELMCERQAKRTDPNETLALKFHFLAYFVSSCAKLASTFSQRPSNKLEGPAILTKVIQYWLKGRDEDGFPTALEEMVRHGLREYPYHVHPLFQQLVRTLASVKMGDEPTSIDLLTSTISGRQITSEEDSACCTCGERRTSSKSLRNCSACKSTQYCDERCQRLHWPSHKRFCSKLAKEYADRQKEALSQTNGTLKPDSGTVDTPSAGMEEPPVGAQDVAPTSEDVKNVGS